MEKLVGGERGTKKELPSKELYLRGETGLRK